MIIFIYFIKNSKCSTKKSKINSSFKICTPLYFNSIIFYDELHVRSHADKENELSVLYKGARHLHHEKFNTDAKQKQKQKKSYLNGPCKMV